MALNKETLKAKLEEDLMDRVNGNMAIRDSKKVYEVALGAVRKHSSHFRTINNRGDVGTKMKVAIQVLAGALTGEYTVEDAAAYMDEVMPDIRAIQAARKGQEDATCTLRGALADMKVYSEGWIPWFGDEEYVEKRLRNSLRRLVHRYGEVKENIPMAKEMFDWIRAGVATGEIKIAVFEGLPEKLEKLSKTLNKWELEAALR